MSAASYLKSRASSAVLSAEERQSVGVSISTLINRLNSYFGGGIGKHFIFGSYTRGTILPRLDDPDSDVDYMVVFPNGGHRPQAYLDRLKRFVEGRYPSSEIYQSAPTIVLSLNHIKFELVPAIEDFWGGYFIPKGPDNWQETDPNGFNETLTSANVLAGSNLKPAIRLMKIWNTANGGIFDSYSLEKWMADQSYWDCPTVKDCLFRAIENLGYPDTTWRREKLTRAKTLVASIKSNDAHGYDVTAQQEAMKLIPVVGG